MRTIRFTALLLLLFVMAMTGNGAVLDNFSSPDGWKKGRNHTGEFTCSAETGMTLEHKPGGPGWISVTKTFEVDLDQNPEFMLKVKSATGSCEVKLVNRSNKEKYSILKFRKPGLYRVNLAEKYKWSGKVRIDVSLYVVSQGKRAVFEFVQFGAPEAAEPPKVTVTPLFHSVGICWRDGSSNPVNLFFHKENGEWQRGCPPVFISEEAGFRGSIVMLDEASNYELKIEDTSGKLLAQEKFRTWSSEVPVARTVELSPENFNGTLRITEQGTPEGWIRYTARPGFVLSNDGSGSLIELNNAAYVLIDGLTLKGGAAHAIHVKNSEFIRIVNCDISGWGRIGKQRFDIDGKFYDENGKAVNFDGGIHINRSRGTVVERCYIHDPRSTANAWFYSHPAGPEGIMISYPTSTVIRYNDIIGSDHHRWNDAIEGAGNFKPDGGFNRDADIYGNFLAFSNDDSIELDGGQQNVRCFFNRFEGWYCGVSIQGCTGGPSYVFRNLLLRGSDRFGSTGQAIKTSSSRSGVNATSFLYNNTVYGPGKGFGMLPHLKIVALNNLFTDRNTVQRPAASPQSIQDYNLLPAPIEPTGAHTIFGDPGLTDPDAGIFTLRADSRAANAGTPIDNFLPSDSQDIGAFQTAHPLALPYRPVQVETDRGVLDFGALPEDGVPVMKFTANAAGTDMPFQIRQNDDSDWFEVSPASGILRSGEPQEFQVKLLPEKMNQRRFFRGALLVRFADGFSRPLSIYAENPKFEEPFRPVVNDSGTVYVDAAAPVSSMIYEVISDPLAEGGKAVLLQGERDKNYAQYEFELEQDGDYYLVFRLRGDAPAEAHDSLFCGVDDDPPAETHLNGNTRWVWSVGAPGKGQFRRLRTYPLKKGKHTIRIAPRESMRLDTIAITDNPAAFEPR